MRIFDFFMSEKVVKKSGKYVITRVCHLQIKKKVL